MKIKILVATHKKCELPTDDVYLPVQVGKALHHDLDLGIQPDNTGDNISVKNPYYSELTAIYWAWKNLDADYVGLAHYRRHFSIQKGKDKFDCILHTDECQQLCSQFDLILPKRRKYYVSSLWNHYKDTHDITHLEKTRKILESKYPQYVNAFDNVMKRTWGHMFNMYIMKKALSDDYCKWLFDILFELEKLIDVSSLSSFDARLFGRVSELLLDVWIEQNQISYKEIGFVQMGNENWPKKISHFLQAKIFGKKYVQSC